MKRYSIKVDGKLIIFSAESQRDALLKSYLISPLYSDLKSLPSRLWHLIWPVLFLLGFLWGENVMKQCRTRSNAHVNGILTMQMMGWNKGYTMDLPQWRVCNVKFSVHGV